MFKVSFHFTFKPMLESLVYLVLSYDMSYISYGLKFRFQVKFFKFRNSGNGGYCNYWERTG